jgi:hypothetical protein
MHPTSKIIAIAALLVFSTLAINAQTKTSDLKKIYGQLGMGPASKSGYSGSLSLQSVWKNNLVATVSYQSISANPKNLPSDYKRGYSYFLLFPLPDEMPEQNLNITSITVGKLFPSGRKAWFTTEAGISLVRGVKYAFTRQAVQTDNIIFFGSSSSNYNTEKESLSGVGCALKADFNWAFSSFAGLGVGTYANINSVQSVIGGEIKIIIGWMHREPKIK